MSWTTFFQILVLIIVGCVGLCVVLVGLVESVKELRKKKGE